jgi:dATP pyrophosphohydrolase
LPERVPVVLSPREHLRHEWLPWREAAERVFSWTNADALRMLPFVTRDLARAAALQLPR